MHGATVCDLGFAAAIIDLSDHTPGSSLLRIERDYDLLLTGAEDHSPIICAETRVRLIEDVNSDERSLEAQKGAVI